MTQLLHERATTGRGPIGAVRLAPVVKPYDWGSTHRLADFQGRTPSGEPEAELWMGAHPAGTAMLELEGGPVSLAEAIDADPVGMLGAQTVARFGPRLPFMLKVMAIGRPLSVQVHPTTEQAEQGYADQRASSAAPVLHDPHGKPEQLVALEDVEALVGLRDREDCARLLRLMDSPVTDALADLAIDRGTDAVLLHLAGLTADEREALAGAVAAALPAVSVPLNDDASGDVAALTWVTRLVESHPGDPMVLSPLLLTHHVLAPGESVFVAPGVPHAYLSGLAVEVLANSDNVARAGLTTKPVDVGIFADWLSASAVPVLGHASIIPRVSEEFVLTRLRLGLHRGGARLDPDQGRIVLCVEGEVVCGTTRGSVRITRGQSAFVPASAGVLHLAGPGTVFVATTGSLLGVGRH